MSCVLGRVNAIATNILQATTTPVRRIGLLQSHYYYHHVFPRHTFLFSPNSPFRSLSLSSSPETYTPPVTEKCHLAQATRSEVDVLLKGVNDKVAAEEVKYILEMANRASDRREVLHTDFLIPPIWNEAMVALKKLVDVNAIPNGGYPEAERCRLSVGHPQVLTTAPDTVTALSITGNFGFQPPSHSDFLGSILGTGISRAKLGDIILQGEKGAQVMIVPELVDYIMSTLDKVGKVPVSCTLIRLDEIEYEPPSTKTFKTVESSLRVDALASAGFKLSRSKFAELISKGDVRINWSTVTKNGSTLKTGDIVSVSGQGRLKIGEINTTKKGKYSVELIRYI